MKQHYIGEVKTRHGEYTFDTLIRFHTDKEPDTYLDEVIQLWYGCVDVDDDEYDPPEKEDDGYYFNGGEVFVEGGKCHKVDAKLYNALDGIITEM